MLGGYKELRNVVEYYRSVFYSHYLRLLREKHSRMHSAPRGAVKFSPRVGAMVLAKHANISRAKWPLAVIEKLDRRNAQATIRIINWVETNKLTPDQLTNPSQLYITKVINLPVSSLYPLELPPEEPRDVDSESRATKVARRLSSLSLEVDDGPSTS